MRYHQLIIRFVQQLLEMRVYMLDHNNLISV